MDEPVVCQHIMYWKRVELGTMKLIDPPIPVRCGAPADKVGWSNPWECNGPLGHQFQRFSEVLRWQI